MNANNLGSIIRAILAAAAAFVIGHKLFNTDITDQLWPSIVAGVVAIGTLVWGIATKSATIEAWESGVRFLVSGVAGILVSYGIINQAQAIAVIGAVVTLIPIIQSMLSKQKSTLIATNQLQIGALKKNAA